jgi:hypothetical protein
MDHLNAARRLVPEELSTRDRRQRAVGAGRDSEGHCDGNRAANAIVSRMRAIRLALAVGLLVGAASAKRCKLSDVQRGDGSYAVDGCEELLLFGESVGDEGAIRLAAALATNPQTLLLVDLWHNGIGPAGARALGAALSKNNKLQRLYLNENPLGAEGVRALAQGLGAAAQSPHHLWLSRTGESMPQADINRAQSYFWPDHSALIHVKCGTDTKAHAGARPPAGIFPPTRPPEPLPPPGAGDDGVLALAEALRKNRVLEALDLWECGITATGARALAKALRSNSVLRTLELRGNPMGGAGAQAFAELLPENKPLSTLDLVNTGASDAGRAALRAGLARAKANPYIVIFEDKIGPHQQRTSWEEQGHADAP